jgi:hypothetical protein
MLTAKAPLLWNDINAELPPVAYAWSGGELKLPDVPPKLDWKYVSVVTVLPKPGPIGPIGPIGPMGP